MTAAEALAACLALGVPRDLCQERVDSSMVGGVYCDGSVVAEIGKPKRCVPASVIAQRTAAMRVPTSAPVASSGALQGSRGWLLAGAALVVVGAGAWLLSRPK